MNNEVFTQEEEARILELIASYKDDHSRGVDTLTDSLDNGDDMKFLAIKTENEEDTLVKVPRNSLLAGVGYYVCETAAATAAKTLSVPGFVLKTGGSMKVLMTYINTADAATLNINSTGAKPLYYNGSRASSSNSWSAGETVEIYYDGTSFFANNVSSTQNGGDGIFDISLHADPSSPVKYASLSAALGTNGVNVPEVDRIGGMTIKYIDSSTNRYMQYRFLLSVFTASQFANTANWEPMQRMAYLAGDTEQVGAPSYDVANQSVHVTPQILSASQKAQARANIDVYSQSETASLLQSAISGYQPVVIEGDVTNAADEEDLTSVSSAGASVLKIKDKEYAPLLFSGLGKTNLRKNIQTVGGISQNVLTQEMLSNDHTIYVIQYDYSIVDDIVIPSGCVLEFSGGSITGNDEYSITGNGTILVYYQELSDIIKHVVLLGTFIHKNGAGIPDDVTIELSNGKLKVKEGVYYPNPSGGIPKEDLSEEVQSDLQKASTALQSEDIAGKADAADLTSHTENTNIHVSSNDKTTWDSKYQKPGGGIPKSDLSEEVQQMLESGAAEEFAVLYTPNQVLTDVQKTNALNNIDSKEYNAASYSGKGKVYLQKNTVSIATDVAELPANTTGYSEGDYIHVTADNKYYRDTKAEDPLTHAPIYVWVEVTEDDTKRNILTQSMMNTANTVYVIQYDYDIRGGNLTIPAGCTLVFDGGSFSNFATITFNGTSIEAAGYQIFHFGEMLNKGNFATCNGDFVINGGNGNATYTEITGSITNEQLLSEWFGCVADYSSDGNGEYGTDQSDHIQFAVNTAYNLSKPLYLSPKKRTYLVDNTIFLPSQIAIYGFNDYEKGYEDDENDQTRTRSKIKFRCKYLFRRKKDSASMTEQERLRQRTVADIRHISIKGAYSRGVITKWDGSAWVAWSAQTFNGDKHWIRKTYIFYGFVFIHSTIYDITAEYLGTFLYGAIRYLSKIEKCKVFYSRHFICGAVGQYNSGTGRYDTSHSNHLFYDTDEFGKDTSFTINGVQYNGFEEPAEPFIGVESSPQSVDSYVINNYLSSTATRGITFYGFTSSPLFIFDNFIEFAFVVFWNVTQVGTSNHFIASRNIFDYCYCVWWGAIDNISITDNMIRMPNRKEIMAGENGRTQIHTYWFAGDYDNSKAYSANGSTDCDFLKAYFSEAKAICICPFNNYVGAGYMMGQYPIKGFVFTGNQVTKGDMVFRSNPVPMSGCTGIAIGNNSYDECENNNCDWTFKKADSNPKDWETKNINIESGSVEEFEYDDDVEYSVFNPNCVDSLADRTPVSSIWKNLYGANGLVAIDTSYNGTINDYGLYYIKEKCADQVGIIIDFSTQKKHTIRLWHTGYTCSYGYNHNNDLKPAVFFISMATWDSSANYRAAIAGATGKTIPARVGYYIGSNTLKPIVQVNNDECIEVTFPENVKSAGICLQAIQSIRLQYEDGTIRYKTHDNGSLEDIGHSDSRPLDNLYKSRQFYDADLGKSIVWNGTYWADIVGTRVTYPISFTPTGIPDVALQQPDAGEEYSAVITDATEFSISSLTVKKDNEALTATTDYQYDSATGVLTINVGGTSGVTGAIDILATGARTYWPVDYYLRGCDVSNTAKAAVNSSYTTVVSADTGKTLPETITVKMGGETLAVGTDYTYNSSTGEITVNNVTGGLVITVEAA